MNIYCNTKGYCRTILLCGLIVILLMFTGCGATKVGDIKSELDKFKDQQVTLSGEVVETLSIPFVHKGAYQLDDGTGRIWVIPSGKVPSRGDKVKVTGNIKVGVEVVGKKLGVVLMEEETTR